MERLKRLKEYLVDAEKEPDINRLYIEDLKISIAMQEQLVSRHGSYQMGHGFGQATYS